ncbi:hypothetical protein [Salegentibacter chungangensis]
MKEDQIVKEGTPLLQIIRTSPKLNMENARLALEPTKEKSLGDLRV